MILLNKCGKITVDNNKTNITFPFEIKVEIAPPIQADVQINPSWFFSSISKSIIAL